METENRVLSVDELTRRITYSLREQFPSVCVEGEISNYKPNSSGHAYFSLKDEKAQINAVIFRNAFTAIQARMHLENGVKIRATGSVDFFAPSGRCQLIIRKVEPAGQGDLMARFQELKEKLEAEGLFDPDRKKTLPKLPKRIGVVTSPTGAVIHDILNVLGRRYPNFQLLLAPVKVQGEGAAESICKAIQYMNKTYGPQSAEPLDLLIVGRGGGSLEDLWPFNEEIVARAVAASELPVISAVGHQTDFTLCDFASDQRAETPSAAAELAYPKKSDLEEKLQFLGEALQRRVREQIDRQRYRLQAAAASQVFKNPMSLVEQRAQLVDNLAMRLEHSLKEGITSLRQRLLKIGSLEGHLTTAVFRNRERVSNLEKTFAITKDRKIQALRSSLETDRVAMFHAMQIGIEREKQRMMRISGQLKLLNPFGVVDRGYSLTRKADGSLVRSVAEVKKGEQIQTVLSGGVIISTVEEKKNGRK